MPFYTLSDRPIDVGSVIFETQWKYNVTCTIKYFIMKTLSMWNNLNIGLRNIPAISGYRRALKTQGIVKIMYFIQNSDTISVH